MPVSLDRIVDVTVTRATRVASRRDFGLIMLLGFHNVFPELDRTYADPSEMITDGFTVRDALYRAAVALTSQPGRPRTFKVGRRVGAPVQTIQLTPSTPIEDEVFSITIADVTFSFTALTAPTVADIVTGLFTLMSVDIDAVAVALPSAAAAQVFTSTDFDGVIGGTLAPPRNVSLTFDTSADWLATTAVVTGTDSDGRVQTESFAVPVGGGSTVDGAKVFATVTQIDLPIQGGATGIMDVGVGIIFANPDLAFTPTDNATDLSIAADTAGDWFAYSDATANLGLDDQTAVPTPSLTTDLTNLRAFDADWYGLIVVDAQSSAQILEAAAFAEPIEILYGFHTFDSDVETAVDTDIVSTLRDLARLRTLPFYSRVNAGRFPMAALFGQVLGIDPGAWSPAFKTLSGVVADELSTTAVELIIGSTDSPVSGKGGMIYVEVLPDGTNRGTAVTMGGLTTGAEWADIVQGIDYTVTQIQERTWNQILSVPKVGFTAEGIDRLDGATKGALVKVARPPFGVLVESSIVTEPVPIEDVSGADKQARFYDGIRFDATVQGAIHATRIRGTVRP